MSDMTSSHVVNGPSEIRSDSEIAPMSLSREIAGSTAFGLTLIALFFLAGGIWATSAPLSGAAIAPGVVSPASSRQTVQHLEGGIISEFRVEEGDRVMAGDVLVVLETVGAEAKAGANTSRLRTLAATEARLKAERDGVARLIFDHPVLKDQQSQETLTVIQAQEHQFETRRANNESRKAVLNQRVAQLQQLIEGYNRQLESVRQQYVLIQEEISGVKQLYDKGLERKPRLLALQRSQAELLGMQGELKARIASAGEAISETQLRILGLAIQRNEEVDAELAEVHSLRVSLEEDMRATLDRLKRTEILAPVAGTVLNPRFKTVGGVVGPGEPILDLVPLYDELVIEARVRPTDIDEVHAGQDSYVVFPAFTQRNMLRIEGRVERVGADALEDERSGESYYSARIVVDRDHLQETAPKIELFAGMPADVFIATGERTLLDYLLRPFLYTVEHAMREQ